MAVNVHPNFGSALQITGVLIVNQGQQNQEESKVMPNQQPPVVAKPRKSIFEGVTAKTLAQLPNGVIHVKDK